MKHTVASFSKLRIALFAFFVLLIIVLLYSTTAHHRAGYSVINALNRAKLWLPIAWFSIVILGLLESVLIWQMFFDGGRAVWIENGALVFLNRRYLSVPLDAIQTASFGTFGRYNQQGIVITLLGGDRRVIPTANLLEDRDVILYRLREALGESRNQEPESER